MGWEQTRRFWETTSVVEDAGRYGVQLDARPIRTPARAPLVVPSAELAAAIAGEWEAQEEVLNPATMPLTRTANSAIDKVSEQFEAVADMLAAYGDSDLLCYRADAPAELVALQIAAWDPLLDWASEALGARLLPRTGIVHQSQNEAETARLRGHVHRLSVFELAAFHDLVALSGSLIIGFAVAQQFQGPSELWDVSRVDENWQSQQWGVDDDDAKMVAIKREAFLDAARFFFLATKNLS